MPCIFNAFPKYSGITHTHYLAGTLLSPCYSPGCGQVYLADCCLAQGKTLPGNMFTAEQQANKQRAKTMPWPCVAHRDRGSLKEQKDAQSESRGIAGNTQREMKCVLAGSEKIKFCWMGREEILRRKSSQFRKHLIMCFKLKHMLQYFLTDSLCASS